MIRFDQIEQASLTDVGVRRSHNQDNHTCSLAADEEQWRSRGHLFLVADGMGAHAVGEKASERAVQVIPHVYLKNAQHGPVTALRKAFTEANASIHAFGMANREFQGTGTTGTALLLRPEGAWIGHAGDSRVYRIRDGYIEQLSYDHSLLWEYARIKGIDPDDVEDIPSNVIHRCLGPEPAVKVDVEGPHPLKGGDIFLLCSDGLSGQVSDMEIGAVASLLPPAEACRFLIDLANLRGGPDNVTVLIARIKEGPEANGVAAEPTRARSPFLPRLPWWVWTLLGGFCAAAGATVLAAWQVSGYILVFLLAAAAIVTGLVGLLFDYSARAERGPAGRGATAAEDSSPPLLPAGAAPGRETGPGPQRPQATGRGEEGRDRLDRFSDPPEPRQGAGRHRRPHRRFPRVLPGHAPPHPRPAQTAPQGRSLQAHLGQDEVGPASRAGPERFPQGIAWCRSARGTYSVPSPGSGPRQRGLWQGGLISPGSGSGSG